MSFNEYVLFESEVKGLTKKFQSLKNSIENSLESVNKFKDNKAVIESGNMDIIRQFNKVGESLECAVEEIDTLIQITSEKKKEPEKTNKKSMSDYLIKEGEK